MPSSSPEFDALLGTQARNLALVVGNGVNRYGAADLNSWDRLLLDIARDCGLADLTAVPKGTALTEFFDVLDLGSNGSASDLQTSFCAPMGAWAPQAHHRAIMGWARRHAVPVLTTNFDEVLSKAAEATFLAPSDSKFTDYYPWACRFAHELFEDPCQGFGIWHVNGMARYKRSVRLGLSHYMGSVQRARHWLHRSGDAQLFRAKDRAHWAGARTWMHLVFNKPLLILGLALEENEVFLRWLLIERAKYFKKFPDRRQPAWYVSRHNGLDEREAGKLFFLRALGVAPVRVDVYDQIYATPAWDR
jgi:hypothetical protein